MCLWWYFSPKPFIKRTQILHAVVRGEWVANGTGRRRRGGGDGGAASSLDLAGALVAQHGTQHREGRGTYYHHHHHHSADCFCAFAYYTHTHAHATTTISTAAARDRLSRHSSGSRGHGARGTLHVLF